MMNNSINDDIVREVIYNNTSAVIYINNDDVTTTINAERISYNRWEITSAGESKALLLSNEELLGVIKLYKKMYSGEIRFKFNKLNRVSIIDDVVDMKGGVGKVIISGVLLRNYIKYLGNTVSFNCRINRGSIGEFKLMRFDQPKKVCSTAKSIDYNEINDKAQYEFTLYQNTSVYSLKKINER